MKTNFSIISIIYTIGAFLAFILFSVLAILFFKAKQNLYGIICIIGALWNFYNYYKISQLFAAAEALDIELEQERERLRELEYRVSELEGASGKITPIKVKKLPLSSEKKENLEEPIEDKPVMDPVEPIVVEDSSRASVKCPCCGQIQNAYRLVCWNCGVPFKETKRKNL